MTNPRQTTPFAVVPEHWDLVCLRDVSIKIGSGATPRGGEKAYLHRRENFALVRSQNVFDHYFGMDGLAFINDEQARELRNVWLQSGDVLLNITGDGITFSRACIIPDEILPACVNQRVCIIRTNSDLCIPGFLLAYLTHPQTKQYIETFNAGGSRRAITKGNIESFVIPLPPIAEQRAIAEILESLNNKIELNRRMNATLEATARAIFQSWFVDFDPVYAKARGEQPIGMDAEIAALFPDSFEDSELGLIPAGWRVGRLDDLIVLQRGFDLPSDERIEGAYPILAASGASGTHSEYRVRGPGVTTGRSGVLGRVFYVHEDYWPLNTSLWVKEFKCSRPIHAYFLLATLDFEAFNAGSAVPTLNRNHVHNLPVVVPDIRVVESFEEIARPLFSALRQNERQTEKLAETRDALLPKLISGEIRIEAAL